MGIGDLRAAAQEEEEREGGLLLQPDGGCAGGGGTLRRPRGRPEVVAAYDVHAGW